MVDQGARGSFNPSISLSLTVECGTVLREGRWSRSDRPAGHGSLLLSFPSSFSALALSLPPSPRFTPGRRKVVPWGYLGMIGSAITGGGESKRGAQVQAGGDEKKMGL